MTNITSIKPGENLKGFTVSRPPFVVFTICILLFCIALISLGSYIKNSGVQDYDSDYDWNVLLDEFSKLEFCLQRNQTQPKSISTTTTTASPFNSTLPLLTTASSSEELLEDIDASLHNTSVAISLSLRAHAPGHADGHFGTTHLFSKFKTSDLGLEATENDMYIAFELREPLKSMDCNEKGCNKESMSACLVIIAPQHIFPKTESQPGTCNMTEASKKSKVTKMTVKPAEHADSVQWCNTGTVAQALHEFDPKLTMMLSAAQRSIINMHLMYTSYFLFVMLITCVCYALVKGPPKHRTVLHSTANEKKLSAPI